MNEIIKKIEAEQLKENAPEFNVGDTVKVINGPFENFMGVVEEVNMEKQTLKAKVSMFGRDTPVELDFAQVDKI